MSRGTSLGLKTIQWLIRSVQLFCGVIILGIYSYFLAALANHHLATPTRVKAVEGIAGVAVAYALLGLLLLCCLAGRTLTSFVAMCLDFALLSAYIFVAVANKGGAGSCTGTVNTVFGTGKADDRLDAGGGFTKIPTFHTACKLETACLAIAIIAIFFYVFSIFIELALGRNNQREKRIANSPPQPQMPYTQNPYNNYQPGMMTPSGAPGQQPRRAGFLGRVFGRNRRGRQAVPQFDPNNLPEHAHPGGQRDSEATAVGANEQQQYKYETGYGNDAASPTTHENMVTGHTAPTTTAAAATYTYTIAGDPYTHAGDHYGHAVDDYYRSNTGAHHADTAATLPYPADNPYDSPYEPHLRTEQQHLPPSYDPQGRNNYTDGIYDAR